TNGNWMDTRRFLITRDYDEDIIHSTLVGSIDEANMASPQTLVEFVNWSVTNYPAERYFLDLWGHGKGWQGVTSDKYSGYDWLTMDEIKWALPKFKDRIDVIGFDNCNMAMVEVYTQFLGHVDYIVGSEKEEDAWGWPYDRIFEDLTADPLTSPEDLSRIVAEHYVDWASASNIIYSATASVVDMSKLHELINRTDTLAWELNRTMALYWNEIDEAIRGTEDYSKPPNPKDLYHFAERVNENSSNTPIKMAALNVMDAVEDAVVANEHWTSQGDPGNPVYNAHGITVWLPINGFTNFAIYQGLDFAQMTQWDEFLASFKDPPQRPQVSFVMSHELFDTDGDGNEDKIEIEYKTDTAGLDVLVEVRDSEQELVTTFYTNGTVEDEDYSKSFTHEDFGNTADYYSFFAYLLDEFDLLQNYSEVANIWLGNEKPDVNLSSVELFRADGKRIGGSTGRNPIDGESTLVQALLVNEGNTPLSNLKIQLYAGSALIQTEELNLAVGQAANVSFYWEAKAGSQILRVVVDDGNLVKETNEYNNEVIEGLEVAPYIPTSPITIMGKVRNLDNINIVGAKIQIRNMRTNATINISSDDSGYKKEIDTDWFHEGDMLDIEAEYNSVTSNVTAYAYSDDEEIYANITLDTEVYDFVYFFKLGLIVFEVIGFILVIKYYIGSKRQKGGD
ncbi:MAG: hypothetical protein JSW28_03220, partial [Thermoplasmata archaeon]